MASNTSLVTQITGQAWIRGADGALTPLQTGMTIPANADVVTSSGASVQLQVNGQPPLLIGENRDVQLGAELAQRDVDPATSAAAVPAQADTTGIVAALEAGADPFAELDPTAAVIQGGGPGDGGSSFTRIAAVLELTTPLGLEYPRPTYPRPEEIRLGGVGSNRAPELTGSALTAAGLLDQINDDSDIIVGLNVGQHFTDPDGHDLIFTATGLPPGLTLNPITGVIEGKLDSSASQGGPGGDGVYKVVITATDPFGSKVDLPFTWTTNNPPPVANPDVAKTDENIVVDGNVLTGDKDGNGTDIDPDGDKLTVTEITSGDKTVFAGTPISGVNPDPSKGGGTLTINPDGRYTFEPGDDFDYLAVGEETTIEVTYQITDGDGGYSEATLTITVKGSNDTPVIEIGKPEDAEVTITEIDDGAAGENKTLHTKSGGFSFTDADDSDTHTVTSTSVGNHYLGDFSFAVGADNKIEWTFEVEDKAIDYLHKGETLVQEYVITIDDGKGGTVDQTVTVTIVGTNDAPIIDSSSKTTDDSLVEDGKSSDNISNIEILDLTKAGYDHDVSNLGADDIFKLTGGNSLTINADNGDSISFKEGEWMLSTDKSTDLYDVYTAKDSHGKDVEVHITKDFEVDGLLEDTDSQSIDSLLDDRGVATASAGGSTGASAPASTEMDHGQHNQLINDLIQQGKLATDAQ